MTEQTDLCQLISFTMKKGEQWISLRETRWMTNEWSWLIKRIQVIGLASDLLDGSIRLAIDSMIYLDSPLVYYGIRSKRSLLTPLVCPNHRRLEIELIFPKPVSMGFDLLGRPRSARRIDVLLTGLKARTL